MKYRFLLAAVGVGAFLMFYQNCGKGFSPQDQDSQSSSASPSPSPSPTPSPSPSPTSYCAPLPLPATVYRTVTPAEAGTLHTIIAGAPSGSKILLADGTYNVVRSVTFATDSITLQSQSQNPDSVIIDGMNGYTGTGTDTRVDELIRIYASNVTIADITLRNALNHIVHVAPTATTGNTGTILSGLKIINPGEQAIKVNANGAGSTVFADNGTIKCSLIQLDDTARPHVNGAYSDGCYTGGVDIHQARGWTIRQNRIFGFWCPTGLSEHGVHVWTGSRDTVVEQNWIENNARGIGFGLGGPVTDNSRRNYSDGPCGGVQNLGHYGGRIVNNVIFVRDPNVFSSAAGFDVGIGLEDVCGAFVANNTIFSTQTPSWAGIDVRFNRTPVITNAQLVNNFASYRLTTRDGAQLTQNNNYFTAIAGDFLGASTGNLHLAAGATAAINQGANVGVAVDFDNRTRDSQPDLGAYER